MGKVSDYSKQKRRENDWRTQELKWYLFKVNSLQDIEHPGQKQKSFLNQRETSKANFPKKMGTKGKVSKYTISLINSLGILCLCMSLCTSLKEVSLGIALRKQQFKADQKLSPREFPGGPVVRTLSFYCRGTGSIPGQGTKILHATWPARKRS